MLHPMPWSLVTAPDERQRCCLVIGGERRPELTACRIAAEDGALDDYTYTCTRHADLVAGPGYVVTRVDQFDGELAHAGAPVPAQRVSLRHHGGSGHAHARHATFRRARSISSA